MGLIARNDGDNFERIPPGNYVARCYRIVDTGTQKIEFQGQESFKQKILVGWEVLDNETLMQDGRPFSVHKSYTNSLHEKASLRHDLTNWRGKEFTEEELSGFSLANILSAYCLVNIVHNQSNGNTYANVSSISPLPNGMQKPNAVNPDVLFDLSNPDWDIFESFSDNLKGKISQSPEYKSIKDPSFAATPQSHSSEDDFDDDIPF